MSVTSMYAVFDDTHSFVKIVIFVQHRVPQVIHTPHAPLQVHLGTMCGYKYVINQSGAKIVFKKDEAAVAIEIDRVKPNFPCTLVRTDVALTS